MEVAPIPVLRPSYLMDQEEFQGDLIEGPANIFYQKVDASRADLQRMQFQFRAPSDNLLASPIMFLRMVLKITCPQVWNQVQAYINVHGVLGPTHAGAEVGHVGIVDADVVTQANYKGQYCPSIAFADADALTSCCTSINFLFNGTSLGLNRTNRWFRDFTKCMISSDASAKIYKSSGGRFDQKDQKGVAGVQFNGLLNDDGQFSVNFGAVNDGAAAAVLLANGTVGAQVETGCATIAGITQDTGVSDRTKAFFSLLQDGAADPEGVEGNKTARYLQVSWPVCVSPFNPWRGASVPASCPYRKGPLAIPHLSAGGLDLLMEDFEKSFIRRLGRTSAVLGGGAGNFAANDSNASVAVAIADNTTPYLEIKYFRLSHTRTLKESYRWNCWQAQTFQGPVPPSAANEGFVERVPNFYGLPAIGKDIDEGGDHVAAQMVKASRAGKEWNITFSVINLAQIPSYLLISVPKLSDCYSLAAEQIALPNCMRNLDHNLSIKSMKIIVNSARGAIDPAADTTGFTDAERLWEMTKENCNSEYFKYGGFRQWRDYGCCVLLSSSQYAPGLMACDGVSYPVQIQVEMVLQNRAVDVTALGIQGTARNTCRAHSISQDTIRARAQVTAIFSKLILSTSETSASTNYMSYPLDSSERLMNNAGALR